MDGGGTILPETQKTIDSLLEEHNQGTGRIILISAYASDMADLSGAMPETHEHLPKIKTASGYLLDQVATYMKAPPPPMVPEYWYKAEKFPLAPAFYKDPGNFPPIVRLRFEDDGSVTGSCEYKIQLRDSSPSTYRVNLTGQVSEIEGSGKKRIEIQILDGIREKGKRRQQFAGTITATGTRQRGWEAKWKPGDAKPPGEMTGTEGYITREPKQKKWRINDVSLEYFAGPGKPGTATWTSDIGAWKLNTLRGSGLSYEGVIEFSVDNLYGPDSKITEFGVIRGKNIGFDLFEGTWHLAGLMFKDKDAADANVWSAGVFTGYWRVGKEPKVKFNIIGPKF